MNNTIRFISDLIFFIKSRKGVGKTVIYWIVGLMLGALFLMAIKGMMTRAFT
jgi:hypothetical protein